MQLQHLLTCLLTSQPLSFAMTALLTKLAFVPPRIPADTAAVTYRNADFISAPCVVTVTLVSG